MSAPKKNTNARNYGQSATAHLHARVPPAPLAHWKRTAKARKQTVAALTIETLNRETGYKEN